MFRFVGPPVEIVPLERETINGTRHYVVGDKYYPSVTSVTGSISSKKEGLAKWRERIGDDKADYIMETAASRGTGMHDIAERFLRGEDHTKTDKGERVKPDSLEMFNVMKGQLIENITDIYGLEERLFSHHLGLAGTVDCIAEWDGVTSVIDFKSSRKLKKWEWISDYFMQSCAYSIMWEELTGMPVDSLVILVSVEPLPGDTELNIRRWTPEYANEQQKKVQVFREKRDTWAEPLLALIDNYKKGD
jgi:genome maintenance exonuclease 1